MNLEFQIRYTWNRVFWIFARPIRKTYGFIFRPKRRAVKALLEVGGEILLVRPTYSHRRWSLPGGKVERNESFETGAIREVYEETGLHIDSLTYLGEYQIVFEFQPTTVKVFLAKPRSKDVVVDGIEIGEASWFPIDALPEDRSSKLDQHVAMYKSSLVK